MSLNPTPLKRKIFFLIFDIFISILTLYLAYNLRFNFEVNNIYMDNYYLVLFNLVILKVCAMKYFKLYNVSWRFFTLSDTKKLFYSHLLAYSFFILIYYIFPDQFNPMPRGVLIIDFILSFLFIGFLRISKRLFTEGRSDNTLKRTLLIGVSPYAQTLIKSKNDFYISAIVDNSDMTVNSYFSNFKVQNLNNLENIIKSEKIEAIIITKDLNKEELNSLYERLNQLNIYDIKIVTLSKKEISLKDITVEDLLARYPKDLDKDIVKDFVKNKKVLITGAGGTIGSGISKQCVTYGAKQIILVDNSEFNLYQITEELENYNIKSVMQNVTDKIKLDMTFLNYKPDIVIHAAAYKHVPLCEENIQEAIENNIIGTKNCIDLSIKYDVEKFVLISTDKAVNPTNIMGTTKRICEIYASNVYNKNTKIVTVRFGNVLGSSGSVIPKFKKQLEQNQNITVTHPDITRYFMLISEACELVLQAASLGKAQEIFILNMGQPIKILDLALKMIHLSGKENTKIEFIGLRPGEKLYEELLINDSDISTQYESITIAKTKKFNIEKLNKDIEELLLSKNKLGKLKDIVPEFNHQLNR
ncbi:MAG: nucleoside-diphosphate sugar epimerase/dehydratase [Campylobacterota bacterium]|nr:nucleoside-diphosphate sugar epimerase/dehydratase [Campylobacterota bacterium]